MRTTTRKLQLGLLATLLGFAIGCAEKPKPDEKQNEKSSASAATSQTPPAKADTTAKPPADPWEMDTAKHAIPGTKAAGELAKNPFQPEAMFVGEILSFDATKENAPRLEVSIKLSPKQVAAASSGGKIVVRNDAKPGPDVPEITVTTPSQPNPLVYPEGYALTLEFGTKAKGKLPGKIYLVLPEEKEKSYLAGTFDAEWHRTADQPPGADDVPFAEGKVSVTGASDPVVKVGAIGIRPDDTVAVESVETMLAGVSSSSRSGASALFPSASEKGTGRYEHIRLDPGRYLIFATVAGGPAKWKWLTVESGSREKLDLAIDSAQTGTAEIKVPAGAMEMIHLTPADGPTGKINAIVAATIGLNLGLAKKPMGDMVRFEKLAPDVYEVWGAEKLGTVEVKPGGTVKLDATAKK